LLYGLRRLNRFFRFFRKFKLLYTAHQRGNIQLLRFRFFMRRYWCGRSRGLGHRKAERLQLDRHGRFASLRQCSFYNGCCGIHQFIDRMLAPVFVLLQTAILEQVVIFVAEARNKIVIGAGNIDLIDTGKTHHALRVVDPVADHVAPAVHVFGDIDGAKMDADTYFQFRVILVLIGHHRLAELHRHFQRIFRMLQKAYCRAIPGIQDDAFVISARVQAIGN